jgi:hypothetical protein
MVEFIRLIIGIFVLLVGVIIGNYLANNTKEELKDGQKWFKLIIIVSLIGGFVGLWIGSDVIMFSLFFVAVVTSRSLIK